MKMELERKELREKKLDEIRKKLVESKNPIMFFDLDTDGSFSFLQLKKEFPALVGFPLDKDLKKQKGLLEKYISKLKFDLILIFDIPYLFDEFLSYFEGRQVIWLDHHPTNQKNLIEKFKILHLNPLDFDLKDNRPACYWAYKISKNSINLPFVVVGSLADFFLLDIFIELNKNEKKIFDLIFKLENKKFSEIINFISKYSFNDGRVRKKREEFIRFLTYGTNVFIIKNFFDFICKLEDYEDVLKAFKFVENLSLIEILNKIMEDKEFPFVDYNRLMVEYRKRLEIAKKLPEKDFFFYSYIGEHSFAKTLSEELMNYFKNVKIVMVCFKKPSKEWYSCSIRSKGPVINEIISKSLSNLNGRGGGHPLAAGCSVNERDYDKFKKRVFDAFDKLNL